MSFYGCRQKYSKMYRERQRKYNSSSNFEIVDKRGETSPLDFSNYSIATEIKATSYWHVHARTHTHTHTHRTTEQNRKPRESESCSVVSDSLRPHGLYGSWNSPGQNTGVGGLFLRQGIFPTQGSNPGLPHCRRSLYQLSPQGSPHKYVQLISDKGEKAIQWRIAFSINDAEATGKKVNLNLSLTPYTNMNSK